MTTDIQLSYQCQSTNPNHHGFCDGIAVDGEHCECESCQHPELGY